MFRLLDLFVVLLSVFVGLRVADAQQPSDAKAITQLRQVSAAGVQYLLERGQDPEDGSYSKQLGPAVTAMCTSALLDHGIPVTHPKVQKSLEYLEAAIKPDGGIYAPDSTLRNYETSVSLMCFNRANADRRYDETIQNAARFLKGLQWDEGEGHEVTSGFYGGQGYGSHKRPDASNTQFFMDALKAAGEDAESEAIQKALVFMSRCQNLPTGHNSAHFAKVVTDEDRGGFIYSPVGEGESKPGATPEGGLRSYASMSYAGLKSLLHAGVAKDDVRVQAAIDWIGRHYDLETNPGMGPQGLYYYYHVFAKALSVAKMDEVTDIDGTQHNWRADLIATLAKRQAADGSWTNEADRWYEGDPNLVTSYALLALAYCDVEATEANADQAGSN
jgi:squalene-hopene/tetraprenyl-beta-curcumene cyclase